MTEITKSVPGLTGFIIRHANVSYGLAVIVKYAIFAGIAGGAYWKFTNIHFNKGVAACQTAQANADGQILPIVDTLNTETKDANHDHAKKTQENNAAASQAYSKTDIKLAYRQGHNAGKAAERKLNFDATRKNANSCLNDPAALSDGVRRDGEGLQRQIFGDDGQNGSVAGNGTRRAMPEATQGQTIPKAAQGANQRPD